MQELIYDGIFWLSSKLPKGEVLLYIIIKCGENKFKATHTYCTADDFKKFGISFTSLENAKPLLDKIGENIRFLAEHRRQEFELRFTEVSVDLEFGYLTSIANFNLKQKLNAELTTIK